MNTYKYEDVQYFILQHLYYSMGVNRMEHYEYRQLMVPTLQRKIRIKIMERNRSFYDRSNANYRNIKYNSYDIDHVIKDIKSRYGIFGSYEGYNKVNDSIQLFSWG